MSLYWNQWSHEELMSLHGAEFVETDLDESDYEPLKDQDPFFVDMDDLLGISNRDFL